MSNFWQITDNFWQITDIMTTKTIWKVHLNLVDAWQAVVLPGYTGVALVGSQDGELHVWVHVDKRELDKTVNFKVTGTGYPAPEDGKHVGSATIPPYVWHVWEYDDAGIINV